MYVWLKRLSTNFVFPPTHSSNGVLSGMVDSVPGLRKVPKHYFWCLSNLRSSPEFERCFVACLLVHRVHCLSVVPQMGYCDYVMDGGTCIWETKTISSGLTLSFRNSA